MERFTLTVDSSGRVLLPVKLRKQLKLKAGSTLSGSVSDEQLVLQTREQALRRAQAYFSQFRKKGDKLLSEELIEDRRREARRERES